MRAFFQEIYKRIKYFKSTPAHIRQDDIYLVEFPKSGITWLSFILANTIQLKAEPAIEVSFFNFTQIIADINYSKYPRSMNNPFGSRIIKSHAKYNPFYTHVVLLVRNPFNVMLSYYNFLNKLGAVDMEFKKFVENKKYGIDAWVKHTESWLKTNTGGHRFCMVRYEDLMKNNFNTIYSLINLLGWQVEESIVKEAINRSSLKAMRVAEKEYSEQNPKYRLNFVRKKENNISQLDQESFDYIYSKCSHLLNDFWKDIDFKEIFYDDED